MVERIEIPEVGNRFPRLAADSGEVSANLAHPRGLIGRFAGRVMADGHQEIHRSAIEILDVLPSDRVLEIGFGAGRTIRWLSQRAPDGSVAGIDISEAMVAEGLSLNRQAVKEGRVDLRHGCVSRLPWEDGSFSKILDVDCFQFWPDQLENLKEVRRVLREGGTLMLCIRMESCTEGSIETPGFNEEEIERAQRLVWDAGFTIVRQVSCPERPGIVCLFAEK